MPPNLEQEQRSEKVGDISIPDMGNGKEARFGWSCIKTSTFDYNGERSEFYY